jgi:hypothetical protein
MSLGFICNAMLHLTFQAGCQRLLRTRLAFCLPQQRGKKENSRAGGYQKLQVVAHVSKTCGKTEVSRPQGNIPKTAAGLVNAYPTFIGAG